MTSAMFLDDLIDRNLAGDAVGIPSVCSAHPLVLRAALRRGLRDGSPVLIEATCNQVNQDGGYTGMTPADFRDRVFEQATEIGFPPERLILGGDHLGPNPWRRESVATAMAKAEAMVGDYVRAGFGKIHLDASMACADDTGPLDDARVAERAVRLCHAAESACPSDAALRPRYVIGTEVPAPGGAHERIDTLAVTDTAALEVTLATHREAFANAGLEDAWARVVGVVVQPGVEFGHADIVDYDRHAARTLSGFVARMPLGMAFEAHSTDYQRESALRALVEDHFAILKVGPGLTFALREALFALDRIEQEHLPDDDRAHVADTLERAMLETPEQWADYYPGDAAEQAFARRYSLSDRSRYYWSVPAVQAAVTRLFENVVRHPPPITLLSQYLPDACRAVRDGRLPPLANGPGSGKRALTAADLVEHRIDAVLGEYARACGARA